MLHIKNFHLTLLADKILVENRRPDRAWLLKTVHYIVIITRDPLYPSVELFAGKPGNMGAHAQADYVNIFHGLCRTISNHRYQIGHSVTDVLGLHSGHDVRPIQRQRSPFHAHHVVIVQREVFCKKRLSRTFEKRLT